MTIQLNISRIPRLRFSQLADDLFCLIPLPALNPLLSIQGFGSKSYHKLWTSFLGAEHRRKHCEWHLSSDNRIYKRDPDSKWP